VAEGILAPHELTLAYRPERARLGGDVILMGKELVHDLCRTLGLKGGCASIAMVVTIVVDNRRNHHAIR